MNSGKLVLNELGPRARRSLAILAALALVTGVVTRADAQDAATTETVTPLAFGVSHGTLGDGDSCDDRGRFVDSYSVDLEPGMWVTIWVHSDDFDPVLAIEGSGGLAIENDDFVPGSLGSAVELAVREAGRYVVRVRALSPGGNGVYQLSLTRTDPAAGHHLTNGSDVSGSLTTSGIGPLSPQWGSYWFDGVAGERVRFRVTSPSFDTVAVLVGPNGYQWTNDDANDAGPDGSEDPLDSTINAILPEAGTYHVLVFPYGGEGGGAYRIRATSSPPLILRAGQGRPDEGYAGTETEGRILGLYAGISNYPDEEDYLYGCADDATFLAEAFRLRGLQAAEDQIVLTDADVTHDGFLTGLQSLAERSTAQDVVVIFYSGHGDVTENKGTDGVELNGLNETLLLYDRAVVDNAVMAIVDTIEANTIVMALDSCHSGGFERDFMTRPGRIGLFSSSEDILSDTAEPLRSGGYLAYYFRMAVLGEADTHPVDGALLAGELTDYMYSGFLESHELMNPPGSDAPLQILEADRGSVGHGETLWLYPRRPDGQLVETPDTLLQSPPPEESTSAGGSCR